MKCLLLGLQSRRIVDSSVRNPTFSICHVNGDINKWSFRTTKAGAYAEFGTNLNEPLYEELRPSSA